MSKNSYEVEDDYATAVGTLPQKYKIHGGVYTFEDPGQVGGRKALVGARVDFYEVDVPGEDDPAWTDPIGHEPVTEQYLGNAVTQLDGGFEFTFDFLSVNRQVPPFDLIRPDIRVRIHQFVDGDWRQVYEGRTKWNVEEDTPCTILIPEEDTFPVPDPGIAPQTGFQYTSLGLLPLDDVHLVEGYASGQSGDPWQIADVSHQPFCGKLRLFGLFAEAPTVKRYRVQIAEANATHVTGSWRDVADPLYNRCWNDDESRWETVLLGPDPATGCYRNVDFEAEGDWHEHGLKVTWQSANEPDGYYGLQIRGYDDAGTEVVTSDVRILRVDNHPPEASIEAIDAGICGGVALDAHRAILFQVSAYDPDGHVLKYQLQATRGKNADLAYDEVTTRDDPNGLWAGIKQKTLPLKMSTLPAELAACTAALAYNVELHVVGSATDGYHLWHPSQKVVREVNLVVSEKA